MLEINWREGEGEWEGVLMSCMPVYSRTSIDPRISTMPRQIMLGLHPPGRQTLLAPNAKRREVLGEPHEG